MSNTESSVKSAPPAPAYLILDTESVPDGKLLARVKYSGETLSPEEAVSRAQADARSRSYDNSDFLPVTFQYPIAICVIRVGADFGLQAITCIDAPQYRPREMVCKFWQGLASHNKAKLVTFNGRCFDLPLLELAAFRYGCALAGREYAESRRSRFYGNHIDLLDWLSNFGAYRIAGGLNLLSKLLGKPGKMNVAGDQVYALHQAGKIQEINDYCMFDTLEHLFRLPAPRASCQANYPWKRRENW